MRTLRPRVGVGIAALAFLLGSSPPLAAAPDKTVEEALSDSLTHAKVRGVLVDRLGGYGLKIDIDVSGTKVTLKGEVKDDASLKVAKSAAQSVKGVTTVDVQLRVNPAMESVGESAKRESKDAALVARVKTRLLSEVGANALKIDVDAKEGVVSLNGTVPSAEVEKLAIRKAKATRGVKKVVNNLKTV